MSPQKKYLRHELTSAFSEAASKKKTHNLLRSMLKVAEQVRSGVLLPASKNLDAIEVKRKDTGDMRSADAKTFTIETDNQCEDTAQKGLYKAFPDAIVLGEEMFGGADTAGKVKLLEEASITDKVVFLVDALDGTRDFRGGGDGYAVMITAIQNNKVKATVAYRCTDHADPEAYGHTLTYAEDDRVRIDGRAVKSLSERSFSASADKIRGYATFEFIDALKGKGDGKFPNLIGKFDSLSDCWTASKVYTDLLKGDHHFMMVAPPADLFDYPAGIALMEKIGGVARFMDGTPASVAELIRRQPFGKDLEASKDIKNTLVFAVSEDVFNTVQKTVLDALKPQAPQPETPPKP